MLCTSRSETSNVGALLGVAAVGREDVLAEAALGGEGAQHAVGLGVPDAAGDDPPQRGVTDPAKLVRPQT